MATYFLLGKYTAESLRDIGEQRTHDAVGIIEKANGQISSMYGLLGPYDLAIIVNLPGNTDALQVSIELSQATGISFITSPAVPVSRFDSMLSKGTPPEFDDPLNP